MCKGKLHVNSYDCPELAVCSEWSVAEELQVTAQLPLKQHCDKNSPDKVKCTARLNYSRCTYGYMPVTKTATLYNQHLLSPSSIVYAIWMVESILLNFCLSTKILHG